MYAAVSDVEVGTYPDLWQKGRYRVELSTELPFYLADVEAALQQLGYEIIDSDQWGQTHRHRQDSNQIAELDELEEPTEYVRLILRNGDLEEEQTEQAEGQLGSLYDGIYQMCQDICDEYIYEQLYAWSQPLYATATKSCLIYSLV